MGLCPLTELPKYKIVFRVSDGATVRLGFSLSTGRRQCRDPYRESLGRLAPTDYNRVVYRVIPTVIVIIMKVFCPHSLCSHLNV